MTPQEQYTVEHLIELRVAPLDQQIERLKSELAEFKSASAAYERRHVNTLIHAMRIE